MNKYFLYCIIKDEKRYAVLVSDPEKSGMMLQGTTAGKKNKIYMTDIFKKLNFKNHSAIVAINYPKTFEIELNAMK